MAQTARMANVVSERALMVQVIVGRQSRDQARDSLEELERLADTAGAVVVLTAPVDFLLKYRIDAEIARQGRRHCGTERARQ